MKKALVLGSTGETGRLLVKELMGETFLEKLVLIMRSEPKADFINNIPKNDNIDLVIKIIDFKVLKEKYSKDFEDVDVAFSCLGTTRGKSGADGFVLVDHDYVLSAAEVLKEKGCTQFHLLSTANANTDSSFLYLKTKGLLEKHIEELNFTSLHIYRPGVLICNRRESRPFEFLSRNFLRVFDFYHKISIPIEAVARVMCMMSKENTNEEVKVHSNADILRIYTSVRT